MKTKGMNDTLKTGNKGCQFFFCLFYSFFSNAVSFSYTVDCVVVVLLVLLPGTAVLTSRNQLLF